MASVDLHLTTLHEQGYMHDAIEIQTQLILWVMQCLRRITMRSILEDRTKMMQEWSDFIRWVERENCSLL